MLSEQIMKNITYPFTAITGQDDFKLCLLLCMVDPTIGGVLAMGDKGTGKTTTVRGLAQLMMKVSPEFSFVNLPIGATEDRVLGTVKLEVLINEKRAEIQKGLLAQAHKGVLYIDEVNLLNDYLMDVLLDAASSGGYHLERDNISGWLESKFCLVGTMNQEEGNLRPQLLDRFGLSVHVKTPDERALRTNVMRRRMAFDADPAAFCKEWEDEENHLAEQIKEARKGLQNINVPDPLFDSIADLCIDHQVEGLRADILLMKASCAYAALNKKKEVSAQDIQKVLPFVMQHRSKKKSPENNSRNSREKSPGEEKEGDSMRLIMN